jgi:manganese-dependent ADP-ribose/CDP-alcohol diphosphatase
MRNLIAQSFQKQRLRGKIDGPNVWELISPASNNQALNYSWVPAPGWRFISLDSYDVSLIGSASKCRKELAKNILALHNPNDLTVSGGWFTNLPRDKLRYVPYNGGVSDSQLTWLQQTIHSSNIKNEKVIIFSHQPVFSPDRPNSLIWNAEQVLALLHSYPGTVVMWLAGHDHGGQCAVDTQGIYHLIPPAPIECEEGDTAFGVVEVLADQLRLRWHGNSPRKTWHPWPEIIPIL